MPSPNPPLWSHQEEAEAFVNSRKAETGVDAAMLAMVMRSGKSRVTVDLCDQREIKLGFIVAPKNAIDNGVWGENFNLYGQQNYCVLELYKGSIQKRLEQANDFLNWQYHGSKILAINLDVLSASKSTAGGKAFLAWLLRQAWDAFIVDESHNYKSPSGVGSRAAAQLVHGAGKQEIPFRLCLTGTPTPKDPTDIYAQGRILNPLIFGTSVTRLRNELAITKRIPTVPIPITVGWRIASKRNYQPGEKDPWVTSPDLFDQRLHDQYWARFDKLAYTVGSDVLNLPEPLHLPVYCSLTGKARQIYQDLEDDFYAQVEQGEVIAANAMVKSMRLQQAASGFVKLADSGNEVGIDKAKEDLLSEMLSSLDEPVVVFGRFHYDLDAIHRTVFNLDRTSLELSGRRNQLREWQAGKAPVLVVQGQAGGEAVDMTRAKVAIYYSLGPPYAKYYQSLSRLQAKDLGYAPVYYYLLARNTIDEKIYRAYRAGHEANEEVLRR